MYCTLKFTWRYSFLFFSFFFFADLVEFLCANLKELLSGKKHLELILSLIAQLFLKVLDCTRENDRSVRGKLSCYFLNRLYLGKKLNVNFLNFFSFFFFGGGVIWSAQLSLLCLDHNVTKPIPDQKCHHLYRWHNFIMYSVHVCGQLKLFLKCDSWFWPLIPAVV